MSSAGSRLCGPRTLEHWHGCTGKAFRSTYATVQATSPSPVSAWMTPSTPPWGRCQPQQCEDLPTGPSIKSFGAPTRMPAGAPKSVTNSPSSSLFQSKGSVMVNKPLFKGMCHGVSGPPLSAQASTASISLASRQLSLPASCVGFPLQPRPRGMVPSLILMMMHSYNVLPEQAKPAGPCVSS